MKYLMAIDAGTGSIRAVIFDQSGKEIAVSQQEWVHKKIHNVPNSMQFDYSFNWELVKGCIKGAIAKTSIDPEDILAISSSSMREGIVLYDENQNELWAVANVDARASDEVKELKQLYPQLEKEFYKKSGQTFALGALPRLLWVKKNLPDIYEKTAFLSMIDDWILAKLSEKICSNPSNAGTSGIFDLYKRDWDRSMCKKVGLKDDIFPPCYESGTVIGNITNKVSKQTGLSTKTLVVTGGGDVQLGSIGLGVLNSGDTAILGGSFWQQVVNIPKDTNPPENMKIRINPHIKSDYSQAEGITFFSGLIMKWFKDAFCDYERKLAKELGVSAYTLLEDRSRGIPAGSHGIMPIFSDSMNYDKWYHAAPAFLNLSIDSNICNKASMFKSLQENACIVSSINLEKVADFTDTKTDTIVFAGGASKGDQWAQILADVTGCKVKVPKVKEATALGTAMCAAIGAGIFNNFDDISKSWVKWDKEYLPNSKNKEIYDNIKENWKQLYKTQLDLVDKGLTNSMWKAPGL